MYIVIIEMASKFATELLNRITYHTSTRGTDIAFENLKQKHPSLDTDDIFALASIASNLEISEEDREIIKECIRVKGQRNMELIKQIHETYGPKTHSE